MRDVTKRPPSARVRTTAWRPGAGLMYVLFTIYGRHECRRPRTRQDAFELKQREFSKRASNWCQRHLLIRAVAAGRRIAVVARRRTNGAPI